MRSSFIAIAASLVLCSATAHAEEAEDAPGATIVVNGARQGDPLDTAPATRAATDQERIGATVNAASVEDTIKYLPSLVVRKRHIGDNFAPIATRTSGLGSSARSLIYADGAPLSALIANNNGNGSPRWTLVTPEEISRIDVLYGPFSAEYAGNSIGTVVNISTRMPDRFEAQARALVNVQSFSLSRTERTLPTWQGAVSLGGRVGPLALLASWTRTDAKSQPVSFTTITGTTPPAGTTGGYVDQNRTGAPILVLGAGGIEHHVQDTWKVKARLDLGGSAKLTYVLGIWRDDSRSTVDSYLRDGGGAVSYRTAGSGATTGFNSAVYTRDALHFSHGLTLEGGSRAFDWRVTGTAYDYARDWQNNPSPDTATGTTPATGFVGTRNDLPAAFAGGVGTIQKQDGTGWVTLDAKGVLRFGQDDAQVLSFGAHADRETLQSATYTIANWLDSASALGQLRSRSYGNTRTLALWAQGAARLTPTLTLTLGGRQEWWRAYGGANTTLSTTVNATLIQPERSFSAFSPKAMLEWRPGEDYSVRLSAGQAWRFPTVGELYQTATVGTLLANPNPNLAPERARSAELAFEKRDAGGSIRLSLFNEVIRGALISQLNVFTSTTFVQNVDQTRARGIELAIDRRDVIPGIDLQASLTYADAITSRNTAFPAAVGKLLPSVPRWKGTAVVTWRPDERWTLTTAARFASRNWGTLDNSDPVGQTYQGFYKYFVVDLRATYRASEHLTFGAGIDNVNNNTYFLFHPFPQRSFSADVKWTY